ncbi:unnamed protein product [Leuciscus chuanchicus]
MGRGAGAAAIKEALRDLGQCARANRVSTVALTADQGATVRSTLQCLICRAVMENPRWVRVCVERWTTNSLTAQSTGMTVFKNLQGWGGCDCSEGHHKKLGDCWCSSSLF